MRDDFPLSESLSTINSRRRGACDHIHVRSDIWVEVRDKDGNLKSRSFQHNLRTNIGADFWNTQLFGAAPGTAARFIGITTDATAPAAGDTALIGEETAAGLARTAGLTAAHTSGTGQSTFTNTFIYTGSSPKVIAKIGLFTAAGPPVAGTMVLETLLSSTATVNANGDTIAITWTINF